MMKHLSKEQLIQQFFQEVELEKITIANVVNYIREIDSRRLYLDFQCTSLFQFLVEKAKYSKSAAQRRIDAARLAQEVPQVEEELKSGNLNLTQASQIARLVREKEKSGKIDRSVKATLVDAVKNKSTDQTEMILCQMLDVQPKQFEKARVQADESIRREATFTKEEELVLQRVKELLSHKNPNPSFSDLVMEMAKAYLKSNDPIEKVRAAKPMKSRAALSTVPALKTKSPRYIPERTRVDLFQKRKSCQHQHADGTFCCSRFQLEIDHIIPVYQGGTSDPQNLQLLCDQHNRQKYRAARASAG